METIHAHSVAKNGGCQYDIYDLGRRIQKIDNTLFSDVEQGNSHTRFHFKNRLT